MAAVESADQAERNFFIPGRRISYRRIGAPIAGGIVAHEDVGQDSIAQISGADSEGEIGRDRSYSCRGVERAYAILMIKDDTLKNLKGHSERAPRVVLQKRYKGRPVESQRVPQCIFFNDAFRVFRIGGSLETEKSGVLRDIVRLGGVECHFASDGRVYGYVSKLVDRVIKMAGEYVCSVIDQARKGLGA